MSFGDYILQGADVLQIKPRAIKKVASDPGALRHGLAFIVIAGVAAALGSWTLPGLILFPLAYLLRVLVHSGIIHFLVTKGFGGHGSYGQLFRPLSLAYLIDWLLVVGLVINIVPLLGPALMLLLALVVTLWKLVVDTIIIETVYQLDQSKAIVVMAVAVLIFLAILALAGLFFGAALMGSWLVGG